MSLCSANDLLNGGNGAYSTAGVFMLAPDFQAEVSPTDVRLLVIRATCIGTTQLIELARHFTQMDQHLQTHSVADGDIAGRGGVLQGIWMMACNPFWTRSPYQHLSWRSITSVLIWQL